MSKFTRATRSSAAGFSFQAAICSIISTSACIESPQTKHSTSQCGPQLKRESSTSLLLTFRESAVCGASLTSHSWNLSDGVLMENNHQPLPDLSTQFYLQSICSRETFHKWPQRTHTLRTFWPFSSGNHFLGLQGPPTNQGKTICRFFFLQVLPSLLIHNSFLYADICYAKP